MGKYIDNKAFNTSLTAYLQECDAAEAEGKEIPPIPNDIAVSFMKIANGLGSTHRFSRYTFLDEMISDAILACTAKIRNYDYKKYSNPFAYFTQICWFEFIGRISAEYEQKKAVYRVCEQLSLEEFHPDADDVDTSNAYLEFLRESIDRREFDKMHNEESAKKFVHRMLTKREKKQQATTQCALPFEE